MLGAGVQVRCGTIKLQLLLCYYFLSTAHFSERMRTIIWVVPGRKGKKRKEKRIRRAEFAGKIANAIIKWKIKSSEVLAERTQQRIKDERCKSVRVFYGARKRRYGARDASIVWQRVKYERRVLVRVQPKQSDRGCRLVSGA